jgi:hypothetical protein
VKLVVPGEARIVAYEVQTDERGDMLNPEWRTICAGSLTPKNSTVVDIEIARETSCKVR